MEICFIVNIYFSIVILFVGTIFIKLFIKVLINLSSQTTWKVTGKSWIN